MNAPDIVILSENGSHICQYSKHSSYNLLHFMFKNDIARSPIKGAYITVSQTVNNKESTSFVFGLLTAAEGRLLQLEWGAPFPMPSEPLLQELGTLGFGNYDRRLTDDFYDTYTTDDPLVKNLHRFILNWLGQNNIASVRLLGRTAYADKEPELENEGLKIRLMPRENGAFLSQQDITNLIGDATILDIKSAVTALRENRLVSPQFEQQALGFYSALGEGLLEEPTDVNKATALLKQHLPSAQQIN